MQTRILLVEDDEMVGTIVSELLRSSVVTELFGGEVELHWATSAEEGEELFGRHLWSLVITDIELPGADGLEFLTRLRRQHKQVAALVMSTHASFDRAVAAIRAGADDYVAKPVKPHELLAKVSELIELTARRRAEVTGSVLAVGAHPDDVEIGVGGVLSRHVHAGDRVTILTLTGGEAGGDVAARAAESREAAALLGCELIHTGLADRSVSEGAETIGVIADAIAAVEATTVYTHTLRDVHQDHRNVHHATLVAARGVPAVFCYQAPSTSVDFHPGRFVSIDEHLDRKLAAIRAYSSQVAVRRYLEEDLLIATARYWGRFTSSRYVEPLEVVRHSEAGRVAPAEEEVVHDAVA